MSHFKPKPTNNLTVDSDTLKKSPPTPHPHPHPHPSQSVNVRCIMSLGCDSWPENGPFYPQSTQQF